MYTNFTKLQAKLLKTSCAWAQNESLRNSNLRIEHCVKKVHIRSYSGAHFPAFGLNTESNKNTFFSSHTQKYSKIPSKTGKYLPGGIH